MNVTCKVHQGEHEMRPLGGEDYCVGPIGVSKLEVGEGRKDDFGKQRYDLIPFAALAQVVAVLTKGAEKYAPENWRKVEGWRCRYLGAALRHISAWAGGEKLDPEWNLPHLAHAICCLMFALELDK